MNNMQKPIRVHSWAYGYKEKFGRGEAHQASGRGSTPDERVPSGSGVLSDGLVEIVKGLEGG